MRGSLVRVQQDSNFLPMKVLVQRVSEASVKIDGIVVGEIKSGLVAFIGITHTDISSHSSWLANKLVDLRLFQDDEGKINKSLLDVKGEALLISQFTLYAECGKGRRPSFIQAASPELAKTLYLQFVEDVRRLGVSVETGVFGADMKVSLINDGPVTLMLER